MRNNSSLQVEVDIAETPEKALVTLEVELAVPTQVLEITTIVEVFVSSANFGMFSIAPAVDIRTNEIKSIKTQGATVIQYELDIAGIQIGAYRVLLNMLEVANKHSKMLRQIRLISVLDRSRRINLSDLQDTPYPRKSENLPFGLQSNGSLAEKKEPVLRLIFQRPISDDELHSLFPFFCSWDNLVIRGGYLEDVVDMEADLDVEAGLSSQQTYLASQDTVEHLLYEFAGHEAAFDSLINMGHRLHHVFCPLESIEIE